MWRNCWPQTTFPLLPSISRGFLAQVLIPVWLPVPFSRQWSAGTRRIHVPYPRVGLVVLKPVKAGPKADLVAFGSGNSLPPSVYDSPNHQPEEWGDVSISPYQVHPVSPAIFGGYHISCSSCSSLVHQEFIYFVAHSMVDLTRTVQTGNERCTDRTNSSLCENHYNREQVI